MKIKANTTKCKCTDCGAKSGSKHKTDCSETFRLNRVKHCCDECYSTYTDDDYPAHTTYDACIRQTCKCHQVDNQATNPAGGAGYDGDGCVNLEVEPSSGTTKDNQATSEEVLKGYDKDLYQSRFGEGDCTKCGAPVDVLWGHDCPKDTQGDWEAMSLEQMIEQLVLDMTGHELSENDVRSYLRELLKKQKSEIIVKAEGYRNSYDALGKFIEDLSNS